MMSLQVRFAPDRLDCVEKLAHNIAWGGAAELANEALNTCRDDAETAVANIINSTISGNQADLYGGGIYNYSADLNLVNTTITGNSSLQIGSFAATAALGRISSKFSLSTRTGTPVT